MRIAMKRNPYKEVVCLDSAVDDGDAADDVLLELIIDRGSTELRYHAKRLNPKAQTLISQKFSNPADLQLFSRQHEKDPSPKQMA